MARLNRICWSNAISFISNFKLYKSLVTTIFLSGCETWTLLADWKQKKGSRLSKPSAWGNFSASPWLSAEQDQLSLCGVHRNLFWQLLKRWKLAWFGHVTRYNSLFKTILQGTLEGGQRRDWPKKCWIDNIKDWASLPMPELLIRASCRKDWKGLSTVSSLTFPQWPYCLRV